MLNAKPLTRKELLKIKEKTGVDLFKEVLQSKDGNIPLDTEMVGAICEVICPDVADKIDDLPFNQLLKVATESVVDTFGDGPEKK